MFPLASDNHQRGGVYRMAPGALRRRHVQAIPDALANPLVIDIDRPNSGLRPLGDREVGPTPPAIVENLRHGHRTGKLLPLFHRNPPTFR